MKKMIFSLLAIAAMTSCTTTSEDEIDPNAPVEIKLNAGVKALARAEVTQATGIDNGVQFARIDGTTADWTTISTISLIGSIAQNTGGITFSTTQYYPADGSNANIVGFYPAATSITDGVASIKITGEEDVIYAVPVSGNKTSKIDKITFNHLLTQFNFAIARETASTNTDITNVSVTIKEANTKFNLALADGRLSGWNTAISTIKPIENGTATKTASAATQKIMLQPDMPSITLIVSADGYSEQDIIIAGTDEDKFEAGKGYTITLTFKGTGITPSATISEWGTGTAGGGEVK
ncbi:fimbrillin family protein [uncultured Butyricimonas sp.]|uniref:fimbrillin family protein n=1 Tax=uncultured Butyricimonas sp. TaxID=1268785 RepID=UPI0026DADF83|nr:fimbrillin family protein [uncultured Butyricimonas sp.]